MPAKFTEKQRKDVENLIYKSMDIMDKSKTNTDYYRQLFANMSDSQFWSFFNKEFPLRFHYKPSVVEPTMSDAKKALDYIGVPLTEKVKLNYLYKDENGRAVTSKPCTVVYITLKKVQQFITKKNKWSPEIANRNMKHGRLLGADKGSATSDREFEGLSVFQLDNVIEEFSGPKADAMESKNVMYNIIGTTGMVRLSDLPKSPDDSLSRNMFNTYLLGSHLNSNLINQDCYTTYTLKEKRRKGVSRD